MMDILSTVKIHELVVIALLAAVLLVSALLSRRMRRRADKEDNQFLRMLIAHFNGPAAMLLVVALAHIGIGYLPYQWTDLGLIRKPLALAATFAVAWLAVRSIRFLSTLLLSRYSLVGPNNLHARIIHTQVRVMQRAATTVIVVFALAAGLMVFENIRALGLSLLASAGVAGIVLGLAAQKTLGNFFTGIQIALTRPIRLDDVVIVEGQFGWIDEINLTYVVVRVWDESRLILPISYFVEKPFQTWTRKTADMLGSVMLHLDYTMPVEPLRDELARVLAATNLWDGKTGTVQVTDATADSMVVRLLVSADNSGALWDLRCLVREKMIAFVRENYPQHLPRLRADVEGAGSIEGK